MVIFLQSSVIMFLLVLYGICRKEVWVDLNIVLGEIMMKKQWIFITALMTIPVIFGACNNLSKNSDASYEDDSGSKNNIAVHQVAQEDKNIQEADLPKIFQKNIVNGNRELSFLCADYDNDGTLEAFGVSADESTAADERVAKLYFINGKGNCEEIPYPKKEDFVVETWVKNDFVGDGEIVGQDDEKFFVWIENFGGPGSLAHVFGVKDGKYFRTNISGEVEDFVISEDGLYIGTTSFFKDIDSPDFAGREWMLHYFKYDNTKEEFIEIRSEPADV